MVNTKVLVDASTRPIGTEKGKNFTTGSDFYEKVSYMRILKDGLIWIVIPSYTEVPWPL